MPKVSVTAQAAAAPEKVWELAVDLPRYPEWLTMHDAFTSEVPATLAEGVTYKQRVKLMGMPAEMAWRVVTAQSPGKLELAADGPMGVKAHNRFTVEPSGDGTSVTLEMEFNGPALSGPMAAMVEKQAGAAVKDSLAKFTALLG